VKKLAIFGSGSGSNAEKICAYFTRFSDIEVAFICTNNKNAFIVTRAKKLNLPVVYTTKNDLANFSILHKVLKDYNVDYIVLAGFLLKIPSRMVNYYPKRIINLHPSLLPKYGGKGMYGRNVHKAVLENKEVESGITIHFVNKNYDEGGLILQKRCVLSFDETVESLEKKIRDLEFEYFPKTIEKLLLK
jgi:phosphoribosylglycinamide formyltransferase-1